MNYTNLVVFLKIGELLKDLEDIQICIDALRDGDADDQLVQLELDRKQAYLDARRKRLVRAIGRVYSLN